MIRAEIRDVVTKINQCNPAKKDWAPFFYIDISSIDRKSKRITNPQVLEVSDAPSRARMLIQKGDVLIATVRPNLNNVAMVPAQYDGHIASTGFCVLRTDPGKVLPQYLFYLAQSDHFVTYLIQRASGAGYPAVTDADVLDYKFDLPSIHEQQHIVAALAKADRLRRLRRYALEVAEEYLQAVFLEMFGDLLTTQTHDNIFASLGDVANIASGITKGQQFNGKQTVRVPYLRVANVQDGYLDLSEVKVIDALPADVRQLRLLPGDVLMTEGGDFDKLGRGAIWQGAIDPCIHQNHIFRVRLDQHQVLPAFFEALLQSSYAKGYFLRASKQTTNLATINMTQLKAFPVPVAVMEAQQEFAAIEQRHRRVVALYKEGVRQANLMFDALMEQVFGSVYNP